MLLFLYFSPEEQALIEKASEQLGVAHRCNFTSELDWLFKLVQDKQSVATSDKFPAVVFLNGDAGERDDILTTLKSHEVLNRIPVVCLGYAKPNREIVDLYERGANSYIVKPNDFETMLRVAETALNYWLDTTLLPQQHLENL